MSDEHHHDQRRTSTMSIRRHHHLRVLVALATVGLASFGFATSASARVTTPPPARTANYPWSVTAPCHGPAPSWMTNP